MAQPEVAHLDLIPSPAMILLYHTASVLELKGLFQKCLRVELGGPYYSWIQGIQIPFFFLKEILKLTEK